MIGSARRRKTTKGSLGSYRRRRSVRNARVSGVTMLGGLGLYKGGRGHFRTPIFRHGPEFSPLVAHQSGSLLARWRPHPVTSWIPFFFPPNQTSRAIQDDDKGNRTDHGLYIT